ncbi:MAG: hypothetical protein HW390_1282 [Candidatus Brocadiaceae bacterium]|nr:hypothetical protein [Candidatus Brocadiaceae bacterium]
MEVRLYVNNERVCNINRKNMHENSTLVDIMKSLHFWIKQSHLPPRLEIDLALTAAICYDSWIFC